MNRMLFWHVDELRLLSHPVGPADDEFEPLHPERSGASADASAAVQKLCRALILLLMLSYILLDPPP